MAWEVWGEVYAAGDESSTNIYQPVIFNDDLIIKGCRTWIILTDGITFDSMQMHIYSEKATGGPGEKIHTSTNSWSSSDILTEDNGVKEVWFEFSDIPVKGTITYNFVINFSNYSPTSDAVVAWRRAYPDPVYQTNLTIDTTLLNTAPHTIYFIGGSF